MANKEDFREDLEHLINRYCMESGSDTPDFILANYLSRCLDNFDETVQDREKWYSRPCGNGEAIFNNEKSSK